jgi:putative SOS response-associated peptidase YedK
MCGRFTLHSPPQRLRERFALAAAPDELAARYNIAPTQEVLVIPNRPQRLLRPARWGLIPHWATDMSVGHKMINARAESLAQRPAFRDALRRRRCAIPTDGFYEWQRRGRTRQAFHLRRRDGEPFALAGLWDVWQTPTGERLASCTVVTVPANDAVAPIHDRMPAILEGSQLEAWLDAAEHPPADLAPLLAPCPDDWLEVYPVSSWVNTPDHDGPECIAPA